MTGMKLNRICKAGESVTQGQCPAMYTAEEVPRPTQMVAQGKRLDAATTAELLELGDDELAVALPTETVLRAVGMFMADHGRPGVMTEVQAYLDDEEG